MSGTAPRLHVSARIEDVFHRALGALLVRRGWRPRVTASIGYGDLDSAHVFLRVLFAPVARDTADPQPSVAHAEPSGALEPPRRPRGWRSLVAVPAAGTHVAVTIGGRIHDVVAERGGYVHADLGADLPPGWHEARVQVAGRPPVSCRVRIVDPDADVGVVSDIDDTIVVTWVPRPLLAAWNTFVLREHARRPVAGMSTLLRALAGEDRFMVYLSTGAWNFAPHLERFMAEHGFPPGPLLLTDWGPTSDGWFRSGATHKREALERLHREHPSTRWVLIGDDGQRDPEIYAAFAREHPDVVAAVAIRRLSTTQQVLTTGSPTADAPSEQPHPTTVPWVSGADGDELLTALSALGVLGRSTDGCVTFAQHERTAG